MKLCLLTYDTLHLKTAQVFAHLSAIGRHELGFMVMPFTPRAKRDVFFSHRPDQFVGVGARQLAHVYGVPIHDYKEWRGQTSNYDLFVVCGSNLIDAEFAQTGKIINVHSGLIPSVRGLDSFKWAIMRGEPMGNTLHVIDEEADAGRLIAHLRTPLYSTDTLQSFANRHYEMEIWMLGTLDSVIEQGCVENLPLKEPTMRMPSAVEETLATAFESYKHRYALG